MTSILPKALLASLALLTLSAMSTQAAVIVTLPTASTAGSIQFTHDITFTLTSGFTTSYIEVVFDEWVATDGGRNNLAGFLEGMTPNQVAFEKNGTPMSSTVLGGSGSFWLVDNSATNQSARTPNDGYLDFLLGTTLAIGDTFTLKAATYTMAAGTPPVGFNPQANQTFTGNTFLAISGGQRISADVSLGAVPEPSRALLLLGGLSTLFFRRRKV